MKASNAIALFAVSALLASATLNGQPIVEIVHNGRVGPTPTYPYVGHRYFFEHTPGDNDMPWLRDFAETHGILGNVDLSLDWKDREFAMMKAIIRFTAYHMSWAENSTFPDINRRAKTILSLNEHVFGVQWGCGHSAYAAIGLAQAFGIPARAMCMRSPDLPPNADYLLEMYSTRYNRWILFFQKGFGWIEHETDGPLGIRELQNYDRADPIQAQWDWEAGHWIAEPHPPLVFKPSVVQFAPIAPYYSERWNRDRYQFFAYTARTNPNGTYPECCPDGASTQYLVNDDFVNLQNNNLGYPFTLPVVPIDDPRVNYCLNNVAATATASLTGVTVRLRNNMFEFVGYEAKFNQGDWQPLTVVSPIGGSSFYFWQPTILPSTLSLRGVTIAGVHSPDIVIRALEPPCRSARPSQE